MKILLGDVNAKVGRENIFKPTNGNDSLHQDSNENGVTIVNFATKNLLLRARCSCNETFLSALAPLLIGRIRSSHSDRSEMAFEYTRCKRF
jgi:hypothetical protein